MASHLHRQTPNRLRHNNTNPIGWSQAIKPQPGGTWPRSPSPGLPLSPPGTGVGEWSQLSRPGLRGACAGMVIRPWQDSDEARLDTLLDVTADSMWIEQFHRLHGPDQQHPSGAARASRSTGVGGCSAADRSLRTRSTLVGCHAISKLRRSFGGKVSDQRSSM
jgi:hypothetical protein